MRWLTNNFGLKLLALMVASALSAYVYYEINYPVPDTLYLSLEPEGLAQGLALVNSLPKRVTVSVRGPYRAIRLVRGRDLSATLSLSGFSQPGMMRIPVTVPHLGDLVVTHVEPSDVSVEVDRGKARQFPVQIDHIGELDKRYAIADEQWSPKTVEVRGPDSLLNSIATVQIEPDLTRVNSELDVFAKGSEAKLPILLYDDDHERITSPTLNLDHSAVQYSLDLVPAESIRVLKVIPDYIGQPPGEFLLASLTAKPQYIPVPAQLVRDGDFAVRTEPIDLNGKSQSYLAKPKLIYPFNVPAGSHLPQQVEVTVEIISLADEGLGAMRVAVQVKGESPRYDYVVTPPQLKVISQRLSVLSNAQRTEVTAVLDAAGLAPGDYRLVPQLRLPDTLDDARINPSWVTLTVIEKGR